ncbi:hypothetical protein ACFVYP_25960 [Kitasatospora sp. NPDC058201]|uniref:hypothetical protein n=1 Tax=unclassified Kitasatospora TaxID=2633591 RepID=UPI003660EFD5
MMFGYSDEWWVLLFVPVVLWVPLGPFAMAATGVWCARRPGRRAPRLWSLLLPAVPVAVSATAMVLPTDTWNEPGRLDDLLGYLAVYVGALTVLPWLLGYGLTRLARAVRAGRRENRGADRGADRPEGRTGA